MPQQTIEDLNAIRAATPEAPQDGSAEDIWADIEFLRQLEEQFGLNIDEASKLRELINSYQRLGRQVDLSDDAGEVALEAAGGAGSTLANPTQYDKVNPNPLSGGGMNQN